MTRLLDILDAGAGLVLPSPLTLWVAWRIQRETGRPVLFRQGCPGLGGRPSEMVKFRTKRDATGPGGAPSRTPSA